MLAHDLREVAQARSLLAMMVRRELAARHAGAALGPVWLYAQPILMLGAYYLLFDIVLGARLSGSAPSRGMGIFLIAGMLPWMAFTDALSRSMTSLVDAGPLLQKNPLPPALFPLRTVLSSAVTFAPLMLAVVLGYIPYHGLAVPVLLLPLVIVIEFVTCFLLGYLLAILVAAMRDVQQIVGFLISVGLFLTPILFSFDMFPQAMRWILWLNPMTPIVLAFQSLLLHGQMPEPAVWIAMGLWLALPTLLLDLVLRRSSEQLLDWI
ncbi:MAG: ABC transporter permease [Rhodocyclaceae bacterium]|nr:ABC transporter permease [Rhodocyclaceae bacterium]